MQLCLNGNSIIMNNKIILQEYPNYREKQKKYQKLPYYETKIFIIYKKKIEK
jgi:hypothetical protein